MNRRSLSAAERLDWLRLSRTENIGPITFYRLIDRFGNAPAALERLPELAKRGGRAQPLKAISRRDAEEEIEKLENLGGRIVAACEPDYPAQLAAMEDAPPVISLLGHAHLLSRPCLGVVGARNASLNGRKLAEKLSRDIGAAGFTIVSGLARGIDTAAHEGSLTTGTVAVVAGGIDIIYPAENENLYRRIAQTGAVIAESPFGAQPQARHFPRRNRIVSGLSQGVVVVEAALKSGSLITARLAAEQGRDVFAVPGSPLDPRAQGCNQLLKDGAILVENAQDILGHLGGIGRRPLNEPEHPAPGGLPLGFAEDTEAETAQARAQILEIIDLAPIAVDEVLRECQFSTAAVMTALLELELAGEILRHPGNKICRRTEEL